VEISQRGTLRLNTAAKTVISWTPVDPAALISDVAGVLKFDRQLPRQRCHSLALNTASPDEVGVF
jgi:hypothetical protein